MRYLLPVLLLLAACSNTASDPISPDNQKRLDAGARLEKDYNFPAAIVTYQDIISRGEAPAEAYLKLAEALKKMGHQDDALQTLAAARSAMPGNTRILNALGLAMVAAGQAKDAVGIFDELTAIEPENALYHNGKAIAFDNAGNHVAAQEIYQKALSLSPNAATIKNNFALSLILSGKFKEAIDLLEPLAASDESSPTIRQNLALAYSLIGDDKRAQDIARKDLSPAQTDENRRLYEYYRKTARKNASKIN